MADVTISTKYNIGEFVYYNAIDHVSEDVLREMGSTYNGSVEDIQVTWTGDANECQIKYYVKWSKPDKYGWYTESMLNRSEAQFPMIQLTNA